MSIDDHGTVGKCTRRQAPLYPCAVCKASFRSPDVTPSALVWPDVGALIGEKVPAWSADSFICRGCLNRLRAELVCNEMEKDRGASGELEQEVMKSLRAGELVADDLNQQFEENPHPGRKECGQGCRIRRQLALHRR